MWWKWSVTGQKQRESSADADKVTWWQIGKLVNRETALSSDDC